MVSIIRGALVFCCLIVASSGDTVKLWTKGKEGKLVNVPYVFGNLNAIQKQAINQGMNEIMAATCIRFFPRNCQKDYIRFGFSGEELGSSYLGRKGGEQVVYLNDYGSVNKHRVIHELLHALGFHHQHQRYDRYDFVKIMVQNIKPSSMHAFKLKTGRTDIQGTPYDFDSIMHYYGNAFTINGKDTIIPRDPKWIGKFGHAQKLSAGDILRINRMYNCPGYEKWT